MIRIGKFIRRKRVNIRYLSVHREKRGKDSVWKDVKPPQRKYEYYHIIRKIQRSSFHIMVLSWNRARLQYLSVAETKCFLLKVKKKQNNNNNFMIICPCNL